MPLGQGFSILDVKETNDSKFFKLRSPLESFEWSDKSIHQPEESEDKNVFTMSFEDALEHFACLNVCKAVNMHETRLKGKFIRIQDLDDSSIELVMSKWYYSIDVDHRTRIYIGVHQEDERKIGILTRRPYIEIGIAVLRRTPEGLHLIDLRDF